MARIPVAVLRRNAEIICKDVGLDYGPHYEKDAYGCYRAVMGRVQLVHKASGWDLEQVASEGGGIRQLNGWANSLKSSEMLAFLQGMELAAKQIKGA